MLEPLSSDQAVQIEWILLDCLTLKISFEKKEHKYPTSRQTWIFSSTAVGTSNVARWNVRNT